MKSTTTLKVENATANISNAIGASCGSIVRKLEACHNLCGWTFPCMTYPCYVGSPAVQGHNYTTVNGYIARAESDLILLSLIK